MELSDVYAARERLGGVLRETKLIRSGLSENCQLYLKPENLQVTGSFKIRGAYNKMVSLTEEERARGVVACSAGNHAQGVAFSAREMGVRAVICMPEAAPQVKVEATRSMGAEVVLVPGTYDDAYDEALRLQGIHGYTFVHPFNDEAVIAGQGTVALEILEELPDTDAIVCAVGGGGLISGIAYAAKMLKPDIRIYGVQAQGAPSMFMSFASGYIRRMDTVHTIADGIAVKEPGCITFDYVQKYVDDIFTVRDGEIAAAIAGMMRKEKIVSEGAGAAPVAAALVERIPDLSKEKNVVCVVSGGNIDLPRLLELLKGNK